MTKVAAAAQLPESNALHFGGTAGRGGVSKFSKTTLKRKTPLGELLKLKSPVELSDESSPVNSSMRNTDGAVSGPKKSDSLKPPRFTRMDEHFPVTKISRLFSRKEIHKDTVPSKCVVSLNNSSLSMDLNAKHKVQNSCLDDKDSEGGNDSSNQSNNSTEKFTYNTFKSVKELSVGGEKSNGVSSVDMGKALKGLISCESRAASAPRPDSSDKKGNIMLPTFCSEIRTPGHKIPLDLTLKSYMRLLSSSSVNWFHRLANCATSNSMAMFSNVGCHSQTPTCSAEPTSSGQFHSWVYPQNTLPHAVISALTSAAGGQTDFLSERQQAWEDSLRSLYYMLRKKICQIFYAIVLRAYAVVLLNMYFLATPVLHLAVCKHDVSFSMPLCRSKVEEVSAEDLVELSQIQKHNLGQARATESIIGVDNTPQSLLMFTGNKNVHALYDFLLNYRSLLISLTGGDVPVLYSPVPFENAAHSTPEIKCKQLRRVDNMSSQLKDSYMDSDPKSSYAGICYIVEVRDAYLLPWVVSGICDVMRSHGGNFQSSFSTVSASAGLNVGLDILANDQSSQLANAADELLHENDHPFGIPNTTPSLRRHSAFLKGLKYGECSYTALLSSVE
ncbi:hypothetical protein OROGR_017782 [Orobanche gracilis]